jgi:hypothetical protein
MILPQRPDRLPARGGQPILQLRVGRLPGRRIGQARHQRFEPLPSPLEPITIRPVLHVR